MKNKTIFFSKGFFTGHLAISLQICVKDYYYTIRFWAWDFYRITVDKGVVWVNYSITHKNPEWIIELF